MSEWTIDINKTVKGEEEEDDDILVVRPYQ